MTPKFFEELAPRKKDSTIQAIHAAANRDKPGTFRNFVDQELSLYQRGIFYLCRYPWLGGNPIYETPNHRRFILKMISRVMS